MKKAIEVNNLVKQYGTATAVNNISFEVEQGSRKFDTQNR